eukprot:g2735.t1
MSVLGARADLVGDPSAQEKFQSYVTDRFVLVDASTEAVIPLTMIGGEVERGSYARGSTSTFGVGQVISGWTEGLQLMSVGSEFIFYIPTELGYGQNPRPGGVIKPGDDLIFRVELKQVVKAPEPRATDIEAWDKYTPWNSELPEIVKTGSGLEYVVLASGEEDGVSPQGNDRVVVYYEGRFDDGGEVFDSAFQRGEAAMFPANRVIPGWVEALQLMKPGDRWLVHVPGDLAYGPNGNGPIPPNAALNFETASGVRYIPITNGDINSGSPGPNATIVVNYEAFLADSGARIDSSYARGESSVYQVPELVDGWAEAVQLMNPGDEWLIYVPAAEAFGPEPLGDLIPGNSDLVYRVQLEGFISANDLADVAANTPPPPGPDMAAWEASFPWNPERPDAVALPSGVSIVVLEKSEIEGPTPVPGDQVVVHYEGRLAETSTFFDSSWSTGAPAVFEAGTLVDGFNEALALMAPADALRWGAIKPCLSERTFDFVWAQKFFKLVRALGEPAKHIFSADNGESKGFRGPVESRDDHNAARFDQAGAVLKKLRWIGDMLNDLEVQNHVKRRFARFDQFFHRAGPKIDVEAALLSMRHCGLDIRFTGIHRYHISAQPPHRLADQAAAATNIEDPKTFKRTAGFRI